MGPICLNTPFPKCMIYDQACVAPDDYKIWIYCSILNDQPTYLPSSVLYYAISLPVNKDGYLRKL